MERWHGKVRRIDDDNNLSDPFHSLFIHSHSTLYNSSVKTYCYVTRNHNRVDRFCYNVLHCIVDVCSSISVGLFWLSYFLDSLKRTKLTSRKKNYKLSIQDYLHKHFFRYNITTPAETSLLYAIRINQNVWYWCLIIW